MILLSFIGICIGVIHFLHLSSENIIKANIILALGLIIILVILREIDSHIDAHEKKDIYGTILSLAVLGKQNHNMAFDLKKQVEELTSIKVNK